MRIAVMSLTRDRLDYTKKCFTRLAQYAGVEYDHYVLDQGSTDGTQDWIVDEYQPYAWVAVRENVGISRGLNHLIGHATRAEHDYDLYVKFDNDCWLKSKNTLRRIADVITDQWILSPRIWGLNEPPPINEEVTLNGIEVGVLGQLGGIFMAIPGWVFNQEFRYDENNPTWGMDDVQLSRWFRDRGGSLGYVLGLYAEHYETTEGQKERYPEYWERKKLEMGIA